MNIKKYCVYKHTSPTGKSYIGITNDYIRRCKQHISPTNECRAFASAIQKYGWDNFTHTLLHSHLTEDQARSYETHYILELKTLSPYGYNLTTGGDLNTHTPEVRERISKALTGRVRTEEHKRNLSAARKGQPGRVKSLEERHKLSKALTGRVRSQAHKDSLSVANGHDWVVTDPAGNEYIVHSLHAFCKEHNLDSSVMARVAKGIHNHYKHWKCVKIISTTPGQLH